MLGALRFYFFPSLFCIAPSRHRDLSPCLYRNPFKEGLQGGWGKDRSRFNPLQFRHYCVSANILQKDFQAELQTGKCLTPVTRGALQI